LGIDNNSIFTLLQYVGQEKQNITISDSSGEEKKFNSP